jgi:site-specific DNA-methyltransferase (adenine-specific)
MTAMASMKDKEFELAIVDPPYGIGIVEAIKKSTKKGTSSMFKMTKGGNGADFDKAIPSGEYFSELFRISNNQIIWGGNYFLDYLGSTNGFVVWDKMNGTNPMADAELAWTSFKGASRMFRMHHFSTGYGVKIHPTQKPIALYQWLIKNYAKPGDKILDTHLGSGSSAIAADIMGYDFTGYEIDEDYYKAALDRFNRHKQQCVLEFA